MEVDERARHELYEDAKRVLGMRSAEALMRHLPPTGWGDVATRRDLDVLEGRMDVKIAELRTEIAELRADMADRFRAQTLALVTTFIAGVSVLNAITGAVVIAVLKFT